MNKRALIEKLIAKLENERQTLAAAALSTYEASTHEESKAEDQYDTRGLEASYLAGAQAKRVADVEQVLHSVKHLGFRDYKETEAIGFDSFDRARSRWSYQLLPTSSRRWRHGRRSRWTPCSGHHASIAARRSSHWPLGWRCPPSSTWAIRPKSTRSSPSLDSTCPFLAADQR